MARACVASSSQMAFPQMLRSFFRAEFASDLHPQGAVYNQLRRFSLHRAPLSCRLHNQRTFSSLRRLQTEHPSPSNEPSTTPSQSKRAKAASQSYSKSPRSDRNSRDMTSKDRKSRAIDKGQPQKKMEGWQIQKEALKNKFPEGWRPRKKLSPDALDGIRHLNAIAPDRFTTPVLAQQFKVSPEVIRRILKSKWQASETEMEDRRQRWEKRNDKIWSQMAELGLRPKSTHTQPIDDARILYEDSTGNS